jgi:hypothetical protein
MRDEKRFLQNQIEAFETIRLIKTGEPSHRQYPDPRPELSLWQVITLRNMAIEALRELTKN